MACGLLGLGIVAVALALTGLRHATWGDVDPAGVLIGLVGAALTLAGIWQAAQALRFNDTDVDRWAKELAYAVQQAETQARTQLLGGQDRFIELNFTLRPVPGHQAAGAAETGTLLGVVDYFRDLRPRRLVITGEPGAGKTVLAIELILGLLSDPNRRSEDPVPVRVPAAGWDPDVPVPDWLTGYLRQTFRIKHATARALVNAWRVLPVVDGLDEMDTAKDPGYDSRLGRALRALNAYQQGQHKAQLVLTCRSGHYDALAGGHRNKGPGQPRRRDRRSISRQQQQSAAVGRLWLHDAARVELAPVTVDQAWQFIEAVAGAHERERWQPVLDALTRPEHVLAKALSTPWRLTLAATVYQQTDPVTGAYLRDPTDLAASRARTPAKIRDHLLSLYVPASVTAADVTRRNPRHHHPDQVHSWLAVLARYLNSNTKQPLYLGRVLSGSELILHQLWPLNVTRLNRFIFAFFISLNTIAIVGVCVMAALNSHAWYLVSALFLPVFFLVTWLTIRWPEPVRLNPSQLKTVSGRRRFAAGLAFGFAGGLLPGMLAGLAFGLAAGIMSGLATALVVALPFGLSSVGVATGADPREPLRNDLRVGIVLAVASGLVIGFAGAIPFGPVGGITTGLVAGLQTLFTSAHASTRYFMLVLCMRGRLPWRLGRFLHWCCTDTGLLRVAGIAYQFRHRELQSYLATHAPESQRAAST